MTIQVRANSYSSSASSTGQVILSQYANKYKYFRVTSSGRVVGAGTCSSGIWNLSTSKKDAITLNTRYEISAYYAIITSAKSNSSSETACDVTATLSNT